MKKSGVMPDCQTDFNLMLFIYCACARCFYARARAFKLTFLLMDGIIDIFDKFGFAVALSVTLLIFGYRIVSRYIKYLQETIKDLTKIIEANTAIYNKLYDYLTKT